MSAIGNRYDRGPHADYRAAEGNHGHKRGFNDVKAACAGWLSKKKITTANPDHYPKSRAARERDARRTAK